MIRLIDIRHTATSPLPVDVMNCNCAQDSLARLRELLRTTDLTGLYREVDEAPSHLVRARENLFAWIRESRAQSNCR